MTCASFILHLNWLFFYRCVVVDIEVPCPAFNHWTLYSHSAWNPWFNPRMWLYCCAILTPALQNNCVLFSRAFGNSVETQSMSESCTTREIHYCLWSLTFYSYRTRKYPLQEVKENIIDLESRLIGGFFVIYFLYIRKHYVMQEDQWSFHTRTD